MPSNHERHLPSRPDTRHRLRLVRLLIALLAAVAAIAAMECIVFNLPFWRTLGASTDTNAVHNTLGSGLTRRNDGMLTVTDPTKAYLELTADGTSDYLRIDTESSKVIDKAREQAEAESKANDDKEVFKPLATIHVRADVDGITGKAQSMNPDAIRSHYVRRRVPASCVFGFRKSAARSYRSPTPAPTCAYRSSSIGCACSPWPWCC